MMKNFETSKRTLFFIDSA